ncbi:BamA/TamA family outer membrane protein [Novosphingobium huizhouense]|uniref:BamA/TamA family outer membrane protein n=1 Tax=Novosphingobium huizhouense TaxID=2866625 RepID=UPI001CD8C5BE|nr:BamA/TamA family outer membrane protein [Novosphingobium huizhouense]
MPRRGRLLALASGAGLALAATAATGQESTTPIEDLQDQAETSANATERLVLPIPLSNPTLGTGLALAFVKVYEPEGTGKPWTTGAGALYTSHKDRALAAFHNMALDGDRLRFSGVAGYASLPLKFYGIGSAAGDRGVALDIQQDVIGGRIEGLVRVAANLHAGVRVRVQGVRTRIRTDGDGPIADLIPSIQRRSTIVAVGPSIVFDRTDAPFNPRNGVLAEAHWLVGVPLLGSDFAYSRVTASANVYHALGERTGIAARASICAAGREAPYYDLCNYGQSNDLRGYLNGQYRDRASWAVQAELRRKLWGRLGGVAFAGIGGIAPAIGRLGDTTLLPGAGLGLRYKISQAYGINARVDAAVGKNSHAIYFSVGEAF